VDSPLQHFDQLPDLLRQTGELVIKPRYGQKGIGLYFCRLQNDTFTLNGRPQDLNDFLDTLRPREPEYLIYEFLHQAEYARQIYPASTNTIRVVTVNPERSAEPFVGVAVHRFGTSRSGTVDNWSQGGLSALIDPASGTLGPGVGRSDDRLLARHDAHPDTGAAITGTTIPDWAAVRDELLRLVAVHPYFRFIGWDVMLTDGGCRLIEANSRPDVNLVQVHQPLLRDPRLRAFFRPFGIGR
jgi:hypothetical protein